MKKITIIGGGFTGTLTAVYLIQKAKEPFNLFIINQKETFNKGIAFNHYSKKHLLNVVTSRMSAFKKESDHFLGWLMEQKALSSFTLGSNLKRRIAGKYSRK